MSLTRGPEPAGAAHCWWSPPGHTPLQLRSGMPAENIRASTPSHPNTQHTSTPSTPPNQHTPTTSTLSLTSLVIICLVWIPDARRENTCSTTASQSWRLPSASWLLRVTAGPEAVPGGIMRSSTGLQWTAWNRDTWQGHSQSLDRGGHRVGCEHATCTRTGVVVKHVMVMWQSCDSHVIVSPQAPEPGRAHRSILCNSSMSISPAPNDPIA